MSSKVNLLLSIIFMPTSLPMWKMCWIPFGGRGSYTFHCIISFTHVKENVTQFVYLYIPSKWFVREDICKANNFVLYFHQGYNNCKMLCGDVKVKMYTRAVYGTCGSNWEFGEIAGGNCGWWDKCGGIGTCRVGGTVRIRREMTKVGMKAQEKGE